MSRVRQIQLMPRACHGNVEQPPLFGDHVFASAHQRLEHRGRKLETRRAAGLRQPAFDERGDKHHAELEALGLVDGHDLDGLTCLDRRRFLVLTREQDELEVLHVCVERMIGRGFAKLRDHLCKAARVRGCARRLAGFEPGSQPLEIARLLHQLEEQVAHVEVCRGRGKTFDQRWHRRHGGPPADPSQSNQIAANPHHAKDRDQVFDLRPVMKTTPTDHDVR